MRFVKALLLVLVVPVLPLTPVLGMGDDLSGLERQYYRNSQRGAPRDGFPVLYNPDMVSAEQADKALENHQWVIGIEKNGEAKAYPVGVMGKHELINDHIGDHPITVCW